MLLSSIAPTSKISPGALARYHTEGGAVSYAGKYDRSWSRRRTSRREARILGEMLAAFDPAASILNVPCGAGRFVATIAPDSRRRVVFADNSQAMLDSARATLAELGAPRVELRLEDVTGAKPSERFDVVMCVRLLHHLNGAAFEAAMDYLVAAAQLGIVCTFASSSTWKGRRRARRSKPGRPGETLRSDDTMRDALAARGWRVARSRRVSFFFSTQTWLLLLPAAR